MEWFKPFENSLSGFVTIAKFSLETLSVLCVVMGAINTLQLALTLNRRRRIHPFPFNFLRLRFGIWLALALEFQLGADILATTIAPTLEELGKLALTALIRTFLNVFLGKELEKEYNLKKNREALEDF